MRTLRNYYFDDVDPRSRELERLLADVDRRHKALESSYPTSLVFRETEAPRPAFILRRGQYDLQGEPVERQTPGFLPPMDDSLPRNRLGFARWLLSPEHPLMSRVTVNRFWQQCFSSSCAGFSAPR